MAELIKNKYNNLSRFPSDINEHLPTLYKYATECETILETGVRGCVSSWALVYGLLNNNSVNKAIILNDIYPCNIDELLACTNGLPIIVQYKWLNNLELEIPYNVDLTFIDTWHVYGQLKRELDKFSKITMKYIIMHDTTVDECEGESIRERFHIDTQVKFSGFPRDEITRGLWPAISEFLSLHPEWVLHERFTNNNGLTILKRISANI
jgi:hypothetical protein